MILLESVTPISQGDPTLLPTIPASSGERGISILVGLLKVPGKTLIELDEPQPHLGTSQCGWEPGRLWLARLSHESPFLAKGQGLLISTTGAESVE